MYFTNGDHRAFESLMRDKPGNDHYDSGKEGRFHESKDRESGLFCCPGNVSHRETSFLGKPKHYQPI